MEFASCRYCESVTDPTVQVVGERDFDYSPEQLCFVASGPSLVRIGAAGQLVQELIDLAHAIEISLRDRSIEQQRADGDSKIMGENTKECPPCLRLQALKGREDAFAIEGLTGNDGPIGILNR